jgi:hypothetical protein
MTSARARLRAALLAAAAAVALLAAGVPQADAAPTTKRRTVTRPDGSQVTTYRFGPMRIKPGQNDIAVDFDIKRPARDGWITSFTPDLVRSDGSVPPVDVIHLHHAVWLVDGRPTWAAGEEKTRIRLPQGFGWRYTPQQQWLLNHMIHNLTTNRDTVWITWKMRFVPDGTKAARGMKRVDTRWMDVIPGIYPVFDVIRGSGKDGRFTFPDDSPDPYPGRRVRRPRNQWVVDRDATLVQTAGHVHPGGLYTDLRITRNGQTRLLFRSRAKYYEPAGPVSWDVSMTVTPKRWRVAVKKGDVLSVHATYDSRRGSWYEAMGIMPIAMTETPQGGADPFVTDVAMPGVLSHGHLKENDNHGGERTSLRDPRRLPDGAAGGEVPIRDFLFGRGDLSLSGRAARPPVVPKGQSLVFRNLDAPRYIFHTITSCKAPCTRLTGIAYPLADGPVVFDSAQLGFSRAPFRDPAAQRVTWATPANLADGTYAYFCRVHPFMRGAFRVKG